MQKRIFIEDRLYILVAEGTAMVKKTDPNLFPHGNCCLGGYDGNGQGQHKRVSVEDAGWGRVGESTTEKDRVRWDSGKALLLTWYAGRLRRGGQEPRGYLRRPVQAEKGGPGQEQSL